MQDLNISLVQTALAWEDADANLLAFEQKLDQLNTATDLIILPEMFNSGFSMNAAANAEQMGGKSMQWMTRIAGQKQCAICGSIIIHEEGNFYNRLIWMRPDGSFEFYDKKHLFRMGDEHQHYSAGNNKLIVDLKGWKVMPLICYDLRFPAWSRNEYADGLYAYDLLIYVANWPAARSKAWTSLITARAIENMAYAAGVNRIGTDGRDYEYSGDSMVASPEGLVLEQFPGSMESVITIRLKASTLLELRSKLGVGHDWDHISLG
jgi:predicted amidohydrolase